MAKPSLLIAMISLNLFAYLTIRLRPYIFKTKLFKPMIWNFKLSLLPLGIMLGTVIAYIICMYVFASTGMAFFVYLGYIIFAIGFISWLLMLPNSGYLITELNLTHRQNDLVEVPIWYDIVSILSFAMSGIVNTLFNIVVLQVIFLIGVDPTAITPKDHQSFIITAVIINLLVSIGVYLGREIRFNSWDVMHPIQFLRKLKDHFKSGRVFFEFFLFVFMHTCFFMIMYYALGIPNIFI